MMRMASRIMLAVWVVSLPVMLSAADWPQWRGPDRDARSKETGLLKKWPKNGPELVWTFDKAGSGYGGPAVVGGKLYVMGARGDTEHLFALDNKGRELWSVRIGPLYDFKGNNWSRGPNATPTVDGERLFALGSQGELICVNTSGKEQWRKSMPKDLGGQVSTVGGGPKGMGWGFSWSPLVDGEQLICVPGGPQGLLAALNKKTGEVIWRSKEVKDPATYSSPLLATLGGVKQYIQQTNAGLVGVEAKTGNRLWYFKRKRPWGDVVCPTPIRQGNLIYATATINGGCSLIRVKSDGKKFQAEEVYSAQVDLEFSWRRGEGRQVRLRLSWQPRMGVSGFRRGRREQMGVGPQGVGCWRLRRLAYLCRWPTLRTGRERRNGRGRHAGAESGQVPRDLSLHAAAQIRHSQGERRRVDASGSVGRIFISARSGIAFLLQGEMRHRYVRRAAG